MSYLTTVAKHEWFNQLSSSTLMRLCCQSKKFKPDYKVGLTGQLGEERGVMCHIALQIALWKGNVPELQVLQKDLSAAVRNQQRLVMWRWLLSAVTHALDYAGAILNFVCVALPVASGNLSRILKLNRKNKLVQGLLYSIRPKI